MTIEFRPAVRSNVNLMIGLAGTSGSGKTYTAFRLATGMSGGKRFAVVDTENGRASHYADSFAFDVAELREPFTPERYSDAILAADAAGYPVIVVDSMSHEHAGSGGLLDMQQAEFERMGSRDAAKMASWIKPKFEHKRMLQHLLQLKAHLILCFRAEPKIEMSKVDGKWQVIPKPSLTGLDGWIPICEKNLPFELTVSIMLMPGQPGIPHPIKPLQPQHQHLFPLDQVIDERCGEGIAKWAIGQALEYIDEEQCARLETMCLDNSIDLAALKRAAGVDIIAHIPRDKFDRALTWVETAVKRKNQTGEAHAAVR